MGNLAAFDGTMPGRVGRDHRRHLDGGLCAAVALRCEYPVGMVKRKSSKCDVVDVEASVGVARQANQLGQARGNHFRLADLLAGHRPVAQHARLPVEIPFPGLVEQFAGVLNVVPL